MGKKLRILVATDYSKAGKSAERYAIQFAKATNSYINFLHVFEKASDFSREFSRVERIDHSPMEFETRKLQEHVEELYWALKLTLIKSDYHCTIRKGIIAEEICAEARAMKADFIVLGTHDAPLFQQLFKESHTWQVIDNTKIPVLAIPAGALFTGIHNLIFGTEYRKSELPVIRYLLQLAKLFNARLTVLHVANDGSSPKFENELLKEFMGDVKATMEYDRLNIRLVYADDLNNGLNEFCMKAKSSWLVMSPEKTALLEKAFTPVTSKTRCMTFHTYVPLLTIPDFNYPGNSEFWQTVEKQYN